MQLKKSISALIVIIIICSKFLQSDGLDLSDYPETEIGHSIVPVISLISVIQEYPMSFMFRPSKPSVSVGYKAAPFSISLGENSIFSGKNISWGFGSLVGGVSITQNLSIGCQMISTDWGNDNLHSQGLSLNTTWGQGDRFGGFGLAVNHLYGPDDFHVKDINVTLANFFRYGDWRLAVGYSGHFARCHIHIDDNDDENENYEKSLNINTHNFRSGIYRIMSDHLRVGMELDVSVSIIVLSFSILSNF